ncbi:MAG: hypothetical protein COT71_01600 [Candidatus Andersenbacteria bacterium CG10_big_fil_rev_8_21_14_0_10_54_11]|uniref:Nudix hydrolase domain-containing protein n=1 Tax=Candidatus Andersenbacteria bacterium CG10_big_fil_rev_8_21_14_0_10_54_11 TaxID=1974485 RepID=A0A2M6WZN3_9BACT|nr:MAG: hypothetical protein COT71_01600 [Candidatus Andersenbacteria bacterium CG10_big_fil_rev_8_21_14_0_10_54_11]
MREKIVLQTKGFDVIQREEADSHVWHYVRRKEGVAILALTDDHEVILVRQRRPAISDILIEIPAGGIERGDTDLTAEASRELKEETGFEAGKLEKMIEMYPSPGYYTEKTHIFLATHLSRSQQRLTELEKQNQLKVMQLPLPKVLEMICEGEITDAKTIVAVCLYTQKKLPNNGQQRASR